jgi:short-subunit dehydrogenase
MNASDPSPALPPPTALITGATSGIGLHLAREFAAHGHPLVLVASIPHELESVADVLRREHGVEVHTLDHDLRAEKAPNDLYASLMSRGVHVGILVNNAAVGRAGKFWDTPVEADVGMLRLNIEACVRLTKLFLPLMLQHGGGRIVNTACLAGFEPGPSLAVYHATKAFVLSWSESLAIELEDTPVTVTALCPGPADTEFFAKADLPYSDDRSPSRLTPPRQIAETAYAALMKGERIVLPDGSDLAGSFSRRFLTKREPADLAAAWPAPPPATD